MIKVGLIGCGGMASFYRKIYTEIPNVRLDFVVDVNEETAKSAAEELGVKNYSTDFNDCVNSDVDVIDISTPNHLHKEQFTAAVKAGKHILLQKPISGSIEDAVEILRLSQSSDKKCGVFMSRYCVKAYHVIKDMLKLGVIGNVSSVYARTSYVYRPKPDAPLWRASKELTGGGSLIQLGVHDYDMLEWILDAEITHISAFSENLMSQHVGGDDTTHSIVKFSNGVLGTVESSYCTKEASLKILGNKGSISYVNGVLTVSGESYEGFGIKYDTPKAAAKFSLSYSNDTLFNTENPYEQHMAFINSIIDDTPVPVPISNGFNSLAVVKSAYESAETGQTVCVEEYKNRFLRGKL